MSALSALFNPPRIEPRGGRLVLEGRNTHRRVFDKPISPSPKRITTIEAWFAAHPEPMSCYTIAHGLGMGDSKTYLRRVLDTMVADGKIKKIEARLGNGKQGFMYGL